MNETVKTTIAAEPISVSVEGMTCASCVRRVEVAAAKVPGVAASSVNFATKKLTVDPADGFSAKTLAAAVKKIGYEVAPQTMTLMAHGLKGADDVARLISVLEAAPNTVSVKVDAHSGAVTIASMGGARQREVLVETARLAGFVLKGPDAVGQDHAGHEHMHHAGAEATLKRDVILAAIFTAPLFVLEMGGHLYAPMHHWLMGVIETQTLYYVYFALATVVIFGPGWRFLKSGFPALAHGAPEMNSLVALGVSAAYLYSLVTTFAPGLLPENARHVYYEAATVIVTLILIGRLLEARASGKTGDAIRKLAGLQAKTARVERGGRAIDLPADEVAVGDIVVIRPGERLAVDGEVVEGASYIDESMISGEPVPMEKSIGAHVVGGTINGNGALKFRATKVGGDTMLAQIIALVEQAQGAKLPIQLLVDRVTALFVPVVIGVAVLTFIAWAIFGPQPAYTYALINAVAVLIIACPCAMGLATPTSIMVGTGRAAELGVLFRKGAALQALRSAGIVVVDKTGTVTKGKPELTDMVVADGFERREVLGLVAAVESRSEHPIAEAIVRAARGQDGLTPAGLEQPTITNFQSITGFGISATVDGRKVDVGADRFMEKLGLSIAAFADTAQKLGEEGKTPIYAAIDGQLAAIIAVADPLKPSSIDAIKALKAMGIEVAMVTGDNARTANAIAGQVGIEKVVAEVLPDGKVQAIKDLKQGGKTLAFVGDGINDAPALAEADIGIAIGTGTDVAIESADVVLVGGDLMGVVHAIEMSRATMRNIRQNLFWAFGYNVALIPVAAGALYPGFGIMLSPMIGAGAMALSSVFVLGNALRLKTAGVSP
ncbi:heavy metal translocating P-type ATPase [Agrobacterium rubi]|uniref:P-type Cu(+) transporter n=1 Tax=Agrobacterium rubi TaxID=28099 RepID=A0AAE7R8S5_9HYPH|nr:heavy metal translocating P-type ATPase [Agrobacterium rubi]NTE85768.1 copper-translocating P-type ATPase [Agrobacterium rubi]NTF01700.1 copper-translocating P-type ATPase [Agrobacterium rubi]NTF35943.1 copper-translocating P-type ATPase [Agrobacterium rubi]OCJ53242.1 ATPase [Agrobacterium rubi]QTG01042.1 copper-translocating P-type ATPase [Agrobacterium rubi]